MIKNYLVVSFRNFRKHKAFSFINVFGLSLGMTVAMLIMMMLSDQKSYDQHHVNKDRTYRILSDDGNSPFPYASSPTPLADALKSEYPSIEQATQLIKGVGGEATYNNRTVEMRGFFTDPAFFEIFNTELESGDPKKALSFPNSIVVSSEVARKLFADEDPLNKIVEFSDRGLHYLGGYRNEPAPTPWGSFVVTGVLSETAHKSHLHFDALVSSASLPSLIAEKKIQDRRTDWTNFYECFTYVMLTQANDHHELNYALADVTQHHYKNSEFQKDFSLQSQRLTDITPGIFTANPTRFSMPLVGYYVLAALALIIILSACLNYASLSIARSLTRAREIGVRKATGANKRAIVFQFLSESILTSLFALAMALAFLALVTPLFQKLWINQYLQFDLTLTTSTCVGFLVLSLLIGIVAGIYPAFHLSSYQPAKALKGSQDNQRTGWGLKTVLNAAQFVISLLFITTSVLIYNQLIHFREFDYGLNTQGVVNIPLQGNNHTKVMNELQSISGVSGISACDIIPATGISNGTRLLTGTRQDDYKYFSALGVDEAFVANFGLKLLAGRLLSQEDVTTSASKFALINHAGVKALGFNHPSDAIGQFFEEGNSNQAVQVIGVVEDFRYKLLIEEDHIGPLLLRPASNFNFINVRLSGANTQNTIAAIEAKWKLIDPAHSFKYDFFDEQLLRTHEAIFDIVSVLGFIAVMAIVISCLGLLGMATFMVERKTREVSIRKIFGAEPWSLAFLLSRGFMRMLLIAILIGGPLSYFVNDLWLQKFPNRVEFGVGTMVPGVLLLLMLGMITIGSQTIKASKGSPVDSIRNG
ncbi:ABC transporter permease [Chryseolinea sp. T2]|uniref:ABC transporter permease n=1 Tax=Chryseolinea sp. T2 TaxID=3129255 RepID=UPI0030781725